MSESCLKIKIDDKFIEEAVGATPISILKKHFKDRKDVISCKINGAYSDMSVSITEDLTLEFCTFDDLGAKNIFWHSSAHILGNAITNLYPNAKLVYGPPTEEGFFYDIDIDSPISSENYKEIENEMMKIIKKNYKFEKQFKTRDELLELYKNNPCKTHFIQKGVETESSIYKNGDFIDMCRGPHVASTGIVKAVKVVKNSSAYFLNDPNEKSLQRVYAISFPSKEMLNNYIQKKEKAKERDHRKLGTELDLFFFHKYSPGSCFFLPDGALIYNVLVEYLRGEYKKRGFKEVITPNIFSTELWKESGHLDNYRDNIFMVEGEDLALKPMNCPGHCLMFRHLDRSFRELPLRLADFGVLHRNELSGALTGLTRVRRFQQDDAHIFCAQEQVKDEIVGCLDFLKSVYAVLKFKFELMLSTRPEKYLGTVEEWDAAEKALGDAMTESGFKYSINEADGAFYGPKIDIILQDALERRIQCATIQLDFQLPQRFNLKFRSTDGQMKTPVIIHRAILGSLERMIAIIIESFGKKLPFWLAPKQVAIIPMANEEYVDEIKRELADFRVHILDDSNTLNKKIRCAETSGFSLVCIVGKKEAETSEINVRYNKSNKNFKLREFKTILKQMNDEKIEFDDVLNISGIKI